MGKRKRPQRSRRDAGTWFFVLIFPGIFIIGGLAALNFGGRRALDGLASPEWPRTEATIVYAGRRSPQSIDVLVAYDYTVDAVRHRSMHHSFSASHARVSHGYRVGQLVPAYYKPGDPATAVLKPGMGTSFALPLFGAAALLAGIAIGRFVYRATA